MADNLDPAALLEGTTEGPWSLCPYQTNGGARDPMDGYIVSGPRGPVGELARCFKGNGDNTKANARLFAAAPDLARALIEAREREQMLRKALQAVVMHGTAYEWPLPEQRCRKMLDEARAALAKVPG